MRTLSLLAAQIIQQEQRHAPAREGLALGRHFCRFALSDRASEAQSCRAMPALVVWLRGSHGTGGQRIRVALRRVECREFADVRHQVSERSMLEPHWINTGLWLGGQ